MNEQKAVDFFKQAGLSRMIEQLREKYVELGRAGGQIILENSTASERQAVASFLGKPLSADVNLKVRMVDVEKAIRHSFGCSLPVLLNAYFPDRSLVTRQEQRANRIARQAAFLQELVSIAEHLPDESLGRRWLLYGPHGLEWLFTRYKNEPTHEQRRQVELVRYTAETLDRLPRAGTPERLALFAQRTSGDPHALDADRPVGRLFLYALADLSKNSGEIRGESGDSDVTYTPENIDVLSDRERTVKLYADVGLLVDTISSNVAVFHLASAINSDGSPDPLVQVAGERVLLLPLRQLLEWQCIVPAQSDIYVFENPQVFEEVIVGLTFSSDNKENRPLPTLVCTSGWPSTAALRLLQMLVDQSPNNRLYYSGDFDLKGLQIAASLMTRYAGRCYPWRFDADSYTVALQAGGVAATMTELAALSMLPEVFNSLVAAMQEKGRWAFQEGIVQLLTEDIITTWLS
jgi:uncharacterized protein (TIGR02679 family)